MSNRASTDNRELSPVSTEELIRARAYELYQERGCQDGQAEYDWQQAECEILSKQAGKQAA
jgi:hypothetical protein